MTYRVELIPSEEGYAIFCPDLPGCVSQGDTEEEALTNIRLAIHDYVEVKHEVEAKRMVRYVVVPSKAMAPEPFQVNPVSFKMPAIDTDKTSAWLDYLDQLDRAESK